MIAVVVATYNRAHLLRQCVENVLNRTSPATTQIVIWDNASIDNTPSYLKSLSDPRLTVVRHHENIAQSAFAPAFARTSAPYLVTLADDIVDAPEHWDATLLDAYRRLPEIGYLGTDLVDDEHDEAAHLRYHVRPHTYTSVEVNGVPLLQGPTGGWCAMTSRDVYDGVGGFRQNKKRLFWSEDATYINDISEIGYSAAILARLKVRHAGGPFYAAPTESKLELAEDILRAVRRKQTVKRALVRVPMVARLNERHGWFSPPDGETGYEEYLDETVRSYRAALQLEERKATRRQG